MERTFGRLQFPYNYKSHIISYYYLYGSLQSKLFIIRIGLKFQASMDTVAYSGIRVVEINYVAVRVY